MLSGLAGVLCTNALTTFRVPRSLYEISVAANKTTATLIVLQLRPRLRPDKLPDPLAGQVSLLMHGNFLIVGLLSGVVFQPPILLAVSILMLARAFFVYHQRTFQQLKLQEKH